MVKTTFIEKILSFVLVIIAVLVMQGCASNYQFGDVTRKVNNLSNNYCTATTPEMKAALKVTLNSLGVHIGVDYCTAYTITNVVVGGGHE